MLNICHIDLNIIYKSFCISAYITDYCILLTLFQRVYYFHEFRHSWCCLARPFHSWYFRSFRWWKFGRWRRCKSTSHSVLLLCWHDLCNYAVLGRNFSISFSYKPFYIIFLESYVVYLNLLFNLRPHYFYCIQLTMKWWNSQNLNISAFAFSSATYFSCFGLHSLISCNFPLFKTFFATRDVVQVRPILDIAFPPRCCGYLL